MRAQGVHGGAWQAWPVLKGVVGGVRGYVPRHVTTHGMSHGVSSTTYLEQPKMASSSFVLLGAGYLSLDILDPVGQ